MKSIDIKGKEYIPVNERVKYFRENFEGWSMTTDIVDYNDESVLIKAIISDPTGREIATGYAREEKASSYINKTSYIENAETSAWGRALANLGIGIDTSMCSAEELLNAVQNQEKAEPVRNTERATKAPQKTAQSAETINAEQKADLINLARQYTGKTDGVEAWLAKQIKVKTIDDCPVDNYKATRDYLAAEIERRTNESRKAEA